MASSSAQSNTKKILLMGSSGSGKTSMRSIIFANYIAAETRSFEATYEIDRRDVKFLGNLSLMLWDCGGQTAFLEEYFNQKETIFRNVALLIYVFDVQSSNRKTDEDYFRRTIEALRDYSPSARVFCLIHKVDLLTEAQSNTVFKKREAELTKISVPMRIQCFKTSIWNETLFKAWSQIVYSLVPNVDTLEQHLTTFCKHSCADEVVLFERSTFLVISHVSTKAFHDEDRFEKVSNIIKQFKLSCGKVGSQFSSMEVRNSSFTGFIDALTDTTMVMVIISDPTLTSPAINMNIRSARKHFSPLIEGHAYKSER